MTPNDEQVSDIVNDVRERFEGIGLQSGDTFQGETEEGSYAAGFTIPGVSHGLQVSGAAGRPFLKLETGYDLAKQFAARKKVAGMAGGVQIESVELEESEVAGCREELRDRAQSDLGEIRQRLASEISVGEIIVDLIADGEFTTGFTLGTRLFPYDGSVSDADLYRSTQRLSSVAFRGKELLVHEYDLRPILDGDDASEDGDVGLRGFE